jgi:hypothetical protein
VRRSARSCSVRRRASSWCTSGIFASNGRSRNIIVTDVFMVRKRGANWRAQHAECLYVWFTREGKSRVAVKRLFAFIESRKS